VLVFQLEAIMKSGIGIRWLLVLSLAGPLVAGAADSSVPALHPEARGDIGYVSGYVSGGFGQEEREALAAVAKDYNLKLVFAEKGSGAYLADVKVSIAGMKGQTILDAVVSNGPWFLVKLPAGRYKITADAEGKTLVRNATITGGRHTQLHFYWRDDDAPETEPAFPAGKD
jgi:hypothetical protein